MRRRRQPEFRLAGKLRADQLDLPRSRSRLLLLERAWAEVAGPAIAGRARIRRFQRGVLELEVPEGPWVATLERLLPKLAGRLAARFPDVGVRKFRLRTPGQQSLPAARPVPEVPAAEQEPPAAAPRRRPPAPPVAAGGPPDDARLERLRLRYLERAAERAARQKP